MLRDRCLVSLYVTLVYCGQTAGWINMLIGTEVDLGPGVIVLDGDPTPELLRTEMGTAAAGPTFGICLLLDEADSLIRC